MNDDKPSKKMPFSYVPPGAKTNLTGQPMERPKTGYNDVEVILQGTELLLKDSPISIWLSQHPDLTVLFTED